MYPEFRHFENEASNHQFEEVPLPTSDRTGDDIGMDFFIGLYHFRLHHQGKKHHILSRTDPLHAIVAG